MSTASDMVAAYLAAELAVLQGQSVTVAGRSLSRANLAEIVKARKEWEQRLAAEQQRAAGITTTGHAIAVFGCDR